MRSAAVARRTGETDIAITLELDGTGTLDIDTGVGFLDHMLSAFGRHGLFDLAVSCKGDTEVDDHHSVEDIGIVLGQAFRQALGNCTGITRFANDMICMDEALVLAAVDISGRGELYWDVPIEAQKVGTFDTELAQEFFAGFARDAGVTLHVKELEGRNAHHIIEAVFKAVGRSMRHACESDPRIQGIPSTKGCL
jgi:imidazoleglycerol-phosphate dehydratase